MFAIVDAAMPEPEQTIFLWLTIAMCAATIIAALLMCRRYRSPAPLLMVIGGLLAVAMEPIITLLGHAIHPEVGAMLLFKSVDRAIPWHIALGYMAVFGAVYLILYPRMVNNSLTASFVWKLYASTVIVYVLFEIVPVSRGLWIYYGEQPLRPFRNMAPLNWSFLNASSEIWSAALMYVVMPRLRGAGVLLLVPLAAVGSAMAHVGAGLPFYNLINSNASRTVVQLSAVAAVLLAMTLVWIATILIELRSRTHS